MFGNGFNSGYGNPYSPYGYATPNYGYNAQPQQQQPQTAQINTNKIYVSGIDEVRQRQLPNGSDMLFLDNDKPIIYQKIVDGKGQFEVKAFTITPYSPVETAKDSQSIDLSAYAKTTDLEPIRAELKVIKEKLDGSVNGKREESL